jgi:hypothetical protein
VPRAEAAAWRDPVRTRDEAVAERALPGRVGTANGQAGLRTGPGGSVHRPASAPREPGMAGVEVAGPWRALPLGRSGAARVPGAAGGAVIKESGSGGGRRPLTLPGSLSGAAPTGAWP